MATAAGRTTARVEVVTTLEIDVDDAVVDEVMSPSWRHSFYTFDTRDEAIAWLAWVINKWGTPNSVDGLYGFQPEQIRVQVIGRDQRVV